METVNQVIPIWLQILGPILSLIAVIGVPLLVFLGKISTNRSKTNVDLVHQQGELIGQLTKRIEHLELMRHDDRNEMMVLQGKLYLAIRQNDFWIERAWDLMQEVNDLHVESGKPAKYHETTLAEWKKAKANNE